MEQAWRPVALLIMALAGQQALAAAPAAPGAAVPNATATTTATLQSSSSLLNHLTVFNKGVGGQNSRGGRARFERDVVKLKPDCVFIYFGLNDALNERAYQTCEQFIENLKAMIASARAAGIKPVLCTIHHAGEEALLRRHPREFYGSEGPNGRIDRYNAAIRALAREQKVPLADWGALHASREKTKKPGAVEPLQALVSPDGVHLTPAGYALLARCFHDTVAAQLKGAETIVCFGDSVTYGAGVKGAGTIEGDTYPAALRRIH